MTSTVEMFSKFIAEAKAGDKTAMKLVRQICKHSMEVAPDRDLLMIAEAIVKLYPEFSPPQPVERN